MTATINQEIIPETNGFIHDLVAQIDDLKTDTPIDVMAWYLRTLNDGDSSFGRSSASFSQVMDLLHTTAEMLHQGTKDFQDGKTRVLPGHEQLVELSRSIFLKIVEVLLPYAIQRDSEEPETDPIDFTAHGRITFRGTTPPEDWVGEAKLTVQNLITTDHQVMNLDIYHVDIYS